MVLQATPSAGAGPDAYRYDEKADFTGGLNFRADQFNLEYNESPALLNVEVDPRGGVRRREGIGKINNTVLPDIISLMTHYESGQNQILAASFDSGQSQIYYNNNATGDFLGPIGTTTFFDTSQPPRSVTFNGFTYIVNGQLLHNSSGVTSFSTVKWDGASFTTLTPDTDGTDGHFPAARYVTTWGDFVWAAYTLESGTTHKNRLRWSKISDAENWTATDFVDIDVGEDGDYITAIIPDQNRLLIFKENSVYELLGFDRDSFQVRNITRTAGNREGCQPVASTSGVFFWYAEDGVFLLREQNLAWAFERIQPAMTYAVGSPALTLETPPSLMWFDERLWVSVDYASDDNLSGSSQTNRRNTFVWDPSLGPIGAWVRRNLLTYRPTNNTHLGIAVTSDITNASSFDRISKVDQNLDYDDYGSSPVNEIISYYQTGWFIGNRPTFPKRWGKTRTVLLADNNATIVMYIYKDYDLSGFYAAYSKSIIGLGAGATWDSAPSGSGDGVWDTSEWQAEGTSDRYLFARWPTVGTAQAISLRFQVTPTPSERGKWGVTSIIGMYRTRRLR